MAVSLRDAWGISRMRLPEQSVLAFNSQVYAKHVHVWAGLLVSSSDRCLGGHPSKSLLSTGRIADKSIGKWSHARLSLLEDIDSSTRGFCAILSGDLVAHERSRSFIYRRPAES